MESILESLNASIHNTCHIYGINCDGAILTYFKIAVRLTEQKHRCTIADIILRATNFPSLFKNMMFGLIVPCVLPLCFTLTLGISQLSFIILIFLKGTCLSCRSITMCHYVKTLLSIIFFDYYSNYSSLCRVLRYK